MSSSSKGSPCRGPTGPAPPPGHPPAAQATSLRDSG
jgi:hypothetical protein